MMSENTLVCFDLTCVKYKENDALGEFLALCTLSPVFIVVFYATIIVCDRRNVTTVIIVLGQFTNLVLNYILKKLLKQSRPVDSDLSNDHSYGMPSNHAQFIGYFGCIYLLSYWYVSKTNRVHAAINKNQTKSKSSILIQLPLYKLSYCENILASTFLLLLMLLTCYSRIYLNYHDYYQVLVGVLVGTAFSYIWFTQIICNASYVIQLSAILSKCDEYIKKHGRM